MLLGVMVTLQVLVLSLRVRISQEHPIYRCSSVGRVLGLGPRCRRFESYLTPLITKKIWWKFGINKTFPYICITEKEKKTCSTNKTLLDYVYIYLRCSRWCWYIALVSEEELIIPFQSLPTKKSTQWLTLNNKSHCFGLVAQSVRAIDS